MESFFKYMLHYLIAMSHRVGNHLGCRTTRPKNIKNSFRAAKAHVRILARTLTAIKLLLLTKNGQLIVDRKELTQN